MLREIDAVTPEVIAEVAAEFFAPERQTVVRLGPENRKSHFS
jgi:predicted Zn-dependent peptidase